MCIRFFRCLHIEQNVIKVVSAQKYSMNGDKIEIHYKGFQTRANIYLPDVEITLRQKD